MSTSIQGNDLINYYLSPPSLLHFDLCTHVQISEA